MIKNLPRVWLKACALLLVPVSLYPMFAQANVERSYYLMGTSLDVVIWQDQESSAQRLLGLAASDEVFRVVQQDERRLSTWISDSELSLLNLSPTGSRQTLSPLLERDLKNATRFAELTEYAFTPWIGPLVRAWGLHDGGKIPGVHELRSAFLASRPDSFRWQGKQLVKRRAGASIEEGGFGKGVALDDAILALRRSGVTSAVLNFGGQISILGSTQVPIEVASPQHRESALLRFHAGEGSIATSGNSEHAMNVGGTKFGHLLDPRTGRPASFEGSITVVTSSGPTSGVEADCLSKIFVMGVDQGMKWALKNHKKILWIVPNNRFEAASDKKWIARTSCDWDATLEKISNEVEVRSECSPKLKGSI